MSIIFNSNDFNLEGLRGPRGFQGATGATGPTGPSGGGGGMLFHSRHTRGTTTDSYTLQKWYTSGITRGTGYLSGSGSDGNGAYYTEFNCPSTGAYEVDLGGWKCGGLDGYAGVEVIRPSAGTVYNQQSQVSVQNCGVFQYTFFIESLIPNDIIKGYVYENVTGTFNSSITDGNAQNVGSIRIKLIT
jgi:hypothetical protein